MLNYKNTKKLMRTSFIWYEKFYLRFLFEKLCLNCTFFLKYLKIMFNFEGLFLAKKNKSEKCDLFHWKGRTFLYKKGKKPEIDFSGDTIGPFLQTTSQGVSDSLTHTLLCVCMQITNTSRIQSVIITDDERLDPSFHDHSSSMVITRQSSFIKIQDEQKIPLHVWSSQVPGFSLKILKVFSGLKVLKL